MTIAPETMNFAVNGIIVIATLFAVIVAPAAGLVITSKVRVRLEAPLVERELLKSQTFQDSVAQMAEHKANNSMAKLLGAYEMVANQLKVLDKLSTEIAALKQDVAVLSALVKERKDHA